ncbi:MAG: lysophospholipid acyltransferase family protein, partial [Mycobacteriales bacterium]
QVPQSGAVLLAGNHTGFLDGPFVYLALDRPVSFLVKAELYRLKWLAKMFDWAGQIPVRRGHPDRTALRRGLEVLRAGGALGVFPEGSRGAGTVESVQHGVGYLALKSGCLVVPVVCLGSLDALPQGAALPRWRAAVDVVFGAPFTVDVTGDPRARSTMAEAAEQVRDRLVAHLQQALAATGRTEVR